MVVDKTAVVRSTAVQVDVRQRGNQVRGHPSGREVPRLLTRATRRPRTAALEMEEAGLPPTTRAAARLPTVVALPASTLLLLALGTLLRHRGHTPLPHQERPDRPPAHSTHLLLQRTVAGDRSTHQHPERAWPQLQVLGEKTTGLGMRRGPLVHKGRAALHCAALARRAQRSGVYYTTVLHTGRIQVELRQG